MHSTLDYLYHLERFGIKLGLEIMQQLAELFDNPQNAFSSIHIAGTNGKGSTACFIANVLKEAGYKVGLYTSPHLIRFNERIKCLCKDDEYEISDEEIITLTEKIKQKIEDYNKDYTWAASKHEQYKPFIQSVAERVAPYGKVPHSNNTAKERVDAVPIEFFQPTFFEFTTMLAFLYFAEQKVDYAVIETGMGGRLDATNIIIPKVSVITSISFDHMKHLGDTLKKITAEKAGIIKQNVPVVIAENPDEVLDVITTIAEERKAPYVYVGDDSEKNKSVKETISQLNLKMIGKHQRNNALNVYLACEKLGLDRKTITKGLEKTFWAGRLEYIKQDKYTFLLDGTHNAAGMKTLCDYLKTIKDNYNKIISIIGFAEDKEIDTMCSLLVPLLDEVIISKGNYKPADPSLIKTIIENQNNNNNNNNKNNIIKIQIQENVEKAIDIAKEKADKSINNQNVLILITGSLYLIGDARKVLKFNASV